MSIPKKFDLVQFPRCLLDYGVIESGSSGREGEILDIMCEKIMVAVQSVLIS